MQDFLKVNNISLRYQTKQEEILAIDDVSFSVSEGEFISLIGPSGCGKSSILSCIAGVNKPDTGNIYLQNKEIITVNKKIGYMLQTDNLFSWRSVYKNVIIGLEVQNKVNEENLNYIDNLLKKYGLWGFKDTFPQRLSGGMRQRVALIRTLATKPDVLLLDEAFSALDYQTRVSVSSDVYNILKDEKKTMIMVTHDIPEAVALSDRIISFSKRPAVIKNIHNIDFSKNRDPISIRSLNNFQDYVRAIWKEVVDSGV